MTIKELLNPYLDQSNYNRAQAIINNKRKFDIKKNFSFGLSIIILTLNKRELIIPLIQQLLEAKKKFIENNIKIEIIIGDTGTTDKDILDFYENHSNDIIVLRNLKYNFSKCNNSIFYDKAQYSCTLFLNNDIIFSNPYEDLSAMLQEFKSENVGIVGSCLFYPNGNVQHAGIDFFQNGEAKALCFHPWHNEAIPFFKNKLSFLVPAVTGACLMIRSELFLLVDGFDENYESECQDVHLCLSIRKLGFDIKCVYAGNIQHLENATRPKGDENWKDRRYFLRKWKSFIEVINNE